MFLNRRSYQSSVQDFHAARTQAALRDILARLTRKSDNLLAYEEVARQLNLAARSERGTQSIPLSAIVGSVGRAADFTRTFLPRREQDLERWARVRTAFMDPDRENMPPIEVYQVGQVYFVLDGNHRVSIARREGMTYIDARVIEIETPVQLTPDMTPEDVICRAELADFLRATELEHAARRFDFSTKKCGQYPRLLAHISAHRQFLNRGQQRPSSLPEAAAHWLENVYAPVIQVIRVHDVMRRFPDHTETDFYLWVVEHQQELQEDLGWNTPAEVAVTDLAAGARPGTGGRATALEEWRRDRLEERYLDRLFSSLLVAVSDSSAAQNALEQALLIARQEHARVLGLYIVRAKPDKTDAKAQALRAQFHARLVEAGVQGELAIESGNVGRKIAERARLTDLTIVPVLHPPAGGISNLASGWRRLLQDVARPLLAVPGEPAGFQRVTLVFDARPQSRQALFVATYMAETWKTALSIVLRRDSTQAYAGAHAYARAYLELHEVNADYMETDASDQTVAEMLRESKADAILAGNDTPSQWQQLRGKGLAPRLLRTSLKPVLIC